MMGKGPSMARVVKADEARDLPVRGLRGTPVRPGGEPLACPEARGPATPEPRPEGESSGHEAEAELDRLRRLVRSVVAQLAAVKERLEQSAQEQAVELATAMAERIVRRELRADPDTFGAMARGAVAAAPRGASVALRVHPDDVALLGHPGQLGSPDGHEAWQVVPDEALQPGDCVVETALELIDARVATQLLQLKEAAERAI